MGPISRRTLLKTAGIMGGAAVVGGLSACSPATNATKDEEISESFSFENAPDSLTDDQIAETIEAEVIVAGAGTAGLVTALSAQQQGLKTILISASSKPIARGGSNNAIYSKTMEKYDVPKVPFEAIRTELVQGSYRVDQQKWSTYYNKSEEAINWMTDIMENAGYMTVLEDHAGFDEKSLFYQPISSHSWCPPDEPSAGGGQEYVVTTLARELENAGGTIYYKNTGRQLVRGGVANGTSGRVDAVIAELEDGSYTKYVGSKAVVLATGDFSGNAEMMQKYCTWAAPFFNDIEEVDYDIGITMQGLYRGDGQQMGLWVGAAWQEVTPNSCMGGNIVVGPWRQLQENFLGLLVNKNGERYMDEAATSALGGMPAMLQPDHEAFAIWNEEYARFHEGKWHTFGSAFSLSPILTPQEKITEWEASVESGTYVKADSLEELIEKAGLPSSTLETIERYNTLCENGEDADFFKDKQFLSPVKEGPFYTTSNSIPDAMTVLGGLRTNMHMQVCDATDTPIDGLYNVGTMVGDFFGGIYTFQLQGANLGANCICFGYLTGKYIAENE